MICDIFGFYLPPGYTFDEIDAVMDGPEADEIRDGDCIECWQEEGAHVLAVVGARCCDCHDNYVADVAAGVRK